MESLFDLLPEPKCSFKSAIIDVRVEVEIDSPDSITNIDNDLRSKMIAERGHARIVPYSVEATKARYPLVPLPLRPTLEEVREETRITAKIIQENLNNIISRTQPKAAGNSSSSQTNIVAQDDNRFIQIRTKAVDPFEPPNVRHKRAPRGPPSPPTPLLHSPPRNKMMTDAIVDGKDWKIPSCISNWKNPYGYTIPLDKRTANNKKGLIGPLSDSSNDLADALAIAERHSKREVELRKEVMNKMNSISSSSTAPTPLSSNRRTDLFEQSLFDGDIDNSNTRFGGKKLRPHYDDLQDQQLYSGSLFAKDAASAANRHIIYNLPKSTSIIGSEGRVMGTERSNSKIEFIPSKHNEKEVDDNESKKNKKNNDDKKYGLK